ncbi:MAG: hypothetical protein ABI234_03105 [Ktedonobacteraceae bacterium]
MADCLTHAQSATNKKTLHYPPNEDERVDFFAVPPQFVGLLAPTHLLPRRLAIVAQHALTHTLNTFAEIIRASL